MKELPALELRRQDLRNQYNSMQRTIGLGLSSASDTNRERLYSEMLMRELAELDYVLTFFSRSSWSRSQWVLLAVIAFFSLTAAGMGLWMSIFG